MKSKLLQSGSASPTRGTKNENRFAKSESIGKFAKIQRKIASDLGRLIGETVEPKSSMCSAGCEAEAT